MEKIKFIRYGGLNSYKQEHRKPDNDKDFHNPPRKSGFYAFPHKYVDFFLLTATNYPSDISGKTIWLKDDNGNIVKENIKYEYDNKSKRDIIVVSEHVNELLKKKNIELKYLRSFYNEKEDVYYLAYYKKPKIFEYYGNIWHHLGENCENFEIIDRTNFWYLTSYDSYLKAFNKNRHQLLKEIHKDHFNESKELLNRIDPYRKSPSYTYAIDDLEVFIEKLK